MGLGTGIRIFSISRYLVGEIKQDVKPYDGEDDTCLLFYGEYLYRIHSFTYLFS